MSKKDFDEYYKQICSQYDEMKDTLNEFEMMSMDNIVSPEQVENFKQTIQPIKDSYLTLSYIAFLLNKPNRKEKIKKYNKQHLKSLDTTNSKEAVINNNEATLQKMKEMCVNG